MYADRVPEPKTAPRRARPLPVEERREALIDATMRALREHRRPLSTREIAQAAGVAEGTIFRIFPSKDDLIDAVVAKAFGSHDGVLQAERISVEQPLRDRLVEFVAILQDQLRNVFGLMDALGLTAPPTTECNLEAEVDRADRLLQALDRLVTLDRPQFRVSTPDLFRYLRLLTFSGSHDGISDGDPLAPEEIVEVILTGVLRPSGDSEKPVDPDGATGHNVLRLP